MKIIHPNSKDDKAINTAMKHDPDNPEWTDDMFRRAVRGVQKAPTKKQLTVRFDPDIVEWFKSQGRGYQAKMNDVLRQHMVEETRPN